MGNTPSSNGRADKMDDLRRLQGISNNNNTSSTMQQEIEAMKKKKTELLLAHSTVSSSSSSSTSSSSSNEDKSIDTNKSSSSSSITYRTDFIQWKHLNKITHMLYYNGNLFTCSLDRHIVKWSLEQKCIKVYCGHTKAVTSLFIDEDVLYSTSNDCTVRAWNIESGECIRVYEGSENWLTCVSANSQYLCTAGYGHNVYVYDLNSGKKVQLLRGHTKRVESLVLSTESSILYSSSMDSTIRIWDIESGECIHVFSCRDHCMKLTLFEANNLLLCGQLDEITVIDIVTNKMLPSIIGISSFTIYQDRFIIGWNSDAKMFMVWDMEGNKFIHSEKCAIAGNMLSTPSIEYHDSTLYFVKGTSIVSYPFQEPLTNDQSTDEQQLFQETSPTYVLYSELYRYYTSVAMLSKKFVTEIISELVDNGSLAEDMSLDNKIEIMGNYITEYENRLKKRQEKSSESSKASEESIGTLQFQIDVDPYDSNMLDELPLYPDELYTLDELEMDFESRVEIFYNKVLYFTVTLLLINNLLVTTR
jgi:WD40 repeat protein